MRKIVKFKLSTKKTMGFVSEGHNYQQYRLLLRGGRVPDMPGLKYKLIRGKFDFQGVKKEKNKSF